MHFQWNPYMGKLVRPVYGHFVDMALDIRLGSSTFGKIIAYDLPAQENRDYDEWIWVPIGFAHGVFFLEESKIEYFCTGEYSPGCEAGISPMAKDINWSLCEPRLKKIFDEVAKTPIISEKDQRGMSVAQWKGDARAKNFVHTK